MKKRVQKLALNRETLHRLNLDAAATQVAGGLKTLNTCPINECTSSCEAACSVRIACCP